MRQALVDLGGPGERRAQRDDAAHRFRHFWPVRARRHRPDSSADQATLVAGGVAALDLDVAAASSTPARGPKLKPWLPSMGCRRPIESRYGAAAMVDASLALRPGNTTTLWPVAAGASLQQRPGWQHRAELPRRIETPPAGRGWVARGRRAEVWGAVRHEHEGLLSRCCLACVHGSSFGLFHRAGRRRFRGAAPCLGLLGDGACRVTTEGGASAYNFRASSNAATRASARSHSCGTARRSAITPKSTLPA